MTTFLKHKHSLLLLIGALTLVPLVIWSFMEPFGVRFGTSDHALKSMGQISALAGTVLFSVGIILRTKLSLFDGSNVKAIGSGSEFVALLLLLAHPIVMITTLLQADGWVLSFGIYSLLLLLAYYAIQFCAGKNKYLEATPHVLGLVLFLGTLHAFFIPSDLSRSPLLQGYMLAIISLAFVSYIYQVTLQRKSLERLEAQKISNQKTAG